MSHTYRSKHEADEFADSVKKKAKSPHEVQLKGYHIASLYCEVHEYKSALPYAESYVAIKPADPRGWKLVGYIYESLKNPAKAIESYRRSLELNDYQKELVLKVAELYCEISYEAEKHRYWAERAEKYFPNHRIIHKIREHILRASKNLKEYEKYLREKLKANSSDVYLNIKLVDILLETSQMREGFLHCSKVEDSCLFDSDPRWWQKAAVFYKTMIGQQSGQADSVLVQAYSRLLLAVNALVGLGLAKSSAPPSHNMLQIQALDKVLLQMTDFLPTIGNALQRPQGDAVIQEVKGQLFFHLATLYLKMAVVGSVSLSDVIEMATSCYIVSQEVAPFHPISQLTLKKEKMDGFTTRLRRLSAARMSEVGHMLKGLADRESEDWLEACREKCCNQQGRQRLFEQIYGLQNPDPRQSYLMMDDAFIVTSSVQLPDMIETVFVYDKASVEGGTTLLQRLVWLGLQWDVRKDGILPDLGSLMEVTFDRLALTTKRLDNTSVDNLCIMDLEAFLYASVFIARTQLRNLHREGLANLNIPVALLVNCYSEEQLEWYMSVYQLYSGKAKPADLGKLRLNAKKGLEVVRCQKNHGIETQLLVELGRTFNARASELRRVTSDPNDRRERREAYQEMSVLYWQAALEHLKMLASNRAVLFPKKPMFSHVHKPIEEPQLSKLIDEGEVVIAQSLFEKGQHQMALSHLAKAKSAEALFAKSMMLHNLASMETESRPVDKITPDVLKRQGDLLDQSKHTLFLTMDTIDGEPRNPLHEEVQTLLEEIEQEQASILDQVTSLDIGRRSDISNLSSMRRSVMDDQSQSQSSSTPLRTPSQNSFRQSVNESRSHTSFHSDQLSPDPSPRRLAAEVRALTLSHTHLLEQNQRLMSREDKLMESNAELMKQILQLTKDLQEVKLQQATAAVQQSASTPVAPSTPPKQAQPVPSPQTPLSQQQMMGNRAAASPSVQQPQSRPLYQPHPAYHPMEAGAYYYPHMVPPSPLPGAGGQAWYPSPYGLPSPMPNSAGYYAPQGYAFPGYDREVAGQPGLVASTPRSAAGRGPLESLYGMYSSIGVSPEDKGAEQLGMAGLKQQQQQQQTPPSAASAGYIPKQLVVSGSAGAALLQGSSPQQKTGQEDAAKAPEKPPLMFKAGSITSGTPTKSPGVTPPVMFAQNAAAAKTQGTPDRGIENITPPVTVPQGMGSKPVTGFVQQGTFKADAGQGTAGAKPSQPAVQPQIPGFSAATTKPSQTFSNLSFTGPAIKPAASIGKPAKTTTATTTQSPFAGFSFGVTSTANSSSSSSTISSTGVFKPTTPTAKPSQPSQGLFGAADQSQGPRTFSPSSGFFATPKVPPVSPQASPQVVQTSPATRKPGQSPLAAATAPKSADAGTLKSVTFKPEIDDDDVILIADSLPSPELQAKAKKLMLPPTFYLYENVPPCKGCFGCIEDLDIASLYTKDDKKGSSVPAVRPKEPTSTPPSTSFGSADSSSLGFGNISAPSGGMFSGGGDSSGGISFASLASNQTSGFAGGFSASGKSFSFANAGAPVFGAQTADHDEADEHTTDAGYDPHYEPIVSLTKMEKIVSGEEDEEELFRHRAKLYRFDRDTKAWKERGVGDIKIQRNPKTGNARVIMRRDQIFKLCANHWITKDMELKPMSMSETAWIWYAVDFSEEEAKEEQLAAKFKHVEDAKRFKEMFEKAQQMLGEKKEAAYKEEPQQEIKSPSVTEANPQLTSLLLAGPSKSPEKKPVSPVAKSNPQLLGLLMGDDKKGALNKESPSTLGASGKGGKVLFPPKSGSWDCDTCYASNNAESTTCAACTAPKPGSAAPTGAKAPTADGKVPFPPKSGPWDCDTCYVSNMAESTTCIACNTPKPGSAAPTGGAAPPSGGATAPTGGPFMLPAGFSLKPQTSTPSTVFGAGASGFGAGASASSSPAGAFKLPPGFSLSQPASTAGAAPTTAKTTEAAPKTSIAATSTTTKDGGSSFQFNLPTNLSTKSSSKDAPAPFMFGGTKDESKTKADTSSKPATTSGATTPGGTVITDKFTFGSGMPQFSFGDQSSSSGTGFSFGASSISAPSKPAGATGGFSFADAAKSMGGDAPAAPITFAQLAESEGATFSFHMDINEVAAKSTPFAKSPGGRSPKTSLSRSPRTRTISGDGEEVEQGEDIYFEPIFTMPDDYVARTGEEGEEVKFSHRAKLYRYDADSKQWKERGLGDIKILHNVEDHTYRIVMRREQVFKVCANHFINEHIILKPNAGSDKSWVWSAMDASDGEVTNEQLAIRFKLAETAKEFKEVVEKAKEDLAKGKKSSEQKSEKQSGKAESTSTGAEAKSELPEVKSCDPKISSAFAEIMKDTMTKSSPTASTGAAAAQDDVNPEEEHDIHFQPIVKLDSNVDLVTGEEEETVEFVNRGKLYRFDTGGRQWKERGIGDIKIMHCAGTGKYRIVMRREQVHKVCANHYITTTMTLSPLSNSDRAWVWHAMDSSDGEPSSEQLAIKFKEVATAASFKEKFEEVKAKIRESEEKDEKSVEDSSASKSDNKDDAPSATGESGDVSTTTASSGSDKNGTGEQTKSETELEQERGEEEEAEEGDDEEYEDDNDDDDDYVDDDDYLSDEEEGETDDDDEDDDEDENPILKF